MLKQITTVLCAGFSISLIVVSCEHKPKDIPKPGKTDSTIVSGKCSPDTVYFTNEILPFINSNCAQAGCHDAITKADGVQLDGYAKIMSTGEVKPGNPNGSKMFEEIKNGKMPPSGTLTQAQMDMISKWIQQGAKNNYCNSICDSTRYTYAADISKIITSNCVACHSSGNVLLNTYNGVKAKVDDGRLWGAINHASGFQPMPSANLTLSACDINKIKKWIDSGAPNN